MQWLSLQMLHQSTYRSPSPFSLIREQDPELLKLLHLPWHSILLPGSTLNPFPTQDHSLTIESAGIFNLNCCLVNLFLPLVSLSYWKVHRRVSSPAAVKGQRSLFVFQSCKNITEICAVSY